uniref:AlNc14C80G5282 protein n=1 Tax=Albugo laibachii Nc14 TaxID=890382 RepID=F0WF90_9STRA|nr:AlNc14C80G5282 [Albugo laibachii Nc14]|eukprot:CCA19872.1 AlNc14C80G5282 [Albugo laibachii Nc14]
MHHRGVSDQHATSLPEINQLLEHIAYNRMARSHVVNIEFGKVFASTVHTLHSDKYICIKAKTVPNLRWGCIGCILKDIPEARLVAISSLYSALILTDVYGELEGCNPCTEIQVTPPYECGQYLAQHVMDAYKHPKLSTLPMRKYWDGSCLAVYFDSMKRLNASDVSR